MTHAAPGPGNRRGSRRGGRRGAPGIWLAVAIASLVAVVLAGYGAYRQLAPRTFTAAQRQRIKAWEVAGRWRKTPTKRLFPDVVRYRLPGDQIGAAGSLRLSAYRLQIARQSACVSVAGASAQVRAMLASQGCQTVLRATYTDASRSLVATVGIAVLRNTSAAADAATRLTGSAAGSVGGTRGAIARHVLLRPVAVPGSPAHKFGVGQRQLSWVASAGPYLVIATVGYADGRPKVQVSRDTYTQVEMVSLASGLADHVASPLGRPARAPHCPGSPAC